jgi:hypothetical protein
MTDKLKPDEDITDLVRFVRSMIKAGAPDETIASSLAAWNRRTHDARLEADRAVIEAARQEFDLGDYIGDDVGVFPAAVRGGDKPYEQRTPDMEHHNAQVTAWFESRAILSDALAALARYDAENKPAASREET